MPNVKLSDSKQIELTSGTYDGVILQAYLKHTTANLALSTADFLPEQVSIKAIYKHREGTFNVLGDSLKLLGTRNTLRKGYHEYNQGQQLVPHASGVKAQLMRTVKVRFGGIIRVAPGEVLTIEINVGAAAFSSNVDSNVSFVDFWANRAIGYMHYIPQVTSKVIPQDSESESFNLGDNIIDIVYLNFDQNDLSTPMINNLTLASDRLDISMNFKQFYGTRHLEYDDVPNARYGTSLPIGTTPSLYRGLDWLPQSAIVFTGGAKKMQELDQCSVTINFETGAVAASQNYLSWVSYTTTKEMLLEAEQRQQRHAKEKLQDIAQKKK